MCPAGLRPRSSVKKKPTAARRSRTKNRKPKFLSLRRQISPENSHPSAKMLTTAANDHQLNLFPLHPEKLVDEKDTHDENVEYFFSAGDGGDTTLTGLLGVAASSSSDDENNALSPSSLTYGYPVQDGEEEGALVRTALKCKERDPSEEKWVCYSEVVEEVTSSAVDRRYKYQARRLSLKLDYEEIMNAWSDKGPLYIHVESPQIVPDLHDDFLSSHEYSNDTNGSGLWRVPEMKGCGGGNGGNAVAIKAEEEEVAEEYWKAIGHREASVLRYKEKRQNRLFSKKIRYEVRKLNAEKRPRIKGRFVKRD